MQTCFGISEFEDDNETAIVLACGSNCSRETGHAELVSTSESGLLSPTTLRSPGRAQVAKKAWIRRFMAVEEMASATGENMKGVVTPPRGVSSLESKGG
jgi:hypothetical protein